MAFFSLVLPVYNVERYLSRCVASINKQVFRDYEIILVNDGSTDQSGKMCDELAKGNERIFSFHKKNGGLADARNYGMDRAKGKYILFIDSDDWVNEKMLTYLYEHLSKSNADVLKYGFQKMQNDIPGAVTYPYFAEGVYDRNQITAGILPGIVGPDPLFNYTRNPVKSAWSHVYSLDFLKKNNIQFVSEREILNEDYLFNLNVMLYAQSVEVIHKVLYYYDYREGSLSKRYIENEFERKIKLHQVYEELLKQCGLFKQYEKNYYNACVDGFYACISNECCGWNETSNLAVQNIKRFVNCKECETALRKCERTGMSVKGRMIYWLMRLKQAELIYLLYKLRNIGCGVRGCYIV